MKPPNPGRVVVIGAGVVGLCTAYYAARRGWTVTVLDGAAPDSEGCSYGNAGLVVPSHIIPLAAPGMVRLALKWMWNPESPFYLRPRLDRHLIEWAWKFYRAANPAHVARSAPLLRDLNLASRACFAQLASELDDDFGFTQAGLLMLCRSQQHLDAEAEMAQAARRLGLQAEVLDARQTADRDPSVRMTVAGSVYFPDDCHLVPERFMRALRQRLDQLQVRFLWNTPVREWDVRASGIASVRIDSGHESADVFILCAASWSQELARQLGIKILVQAGKGYSLTLPNPPQLPRIPAIFTEARLAITPMGDALRFGGTMEFDGLDTRIHRPRIRGIMKAIPQYYPAFSAVEFDKLKSWAGLRPCSPDGLPYVGRSRRCSNLIIATGHAMMGLSLGPITGKLVAELLENAPPSIDLDLLAPDRHSSSSVR